MEATTGLVVRLELTVDDEVNPGGSRTLFWAERTWHDLNLDQVRAMGAVMPEVLERLTAAAEGRDDEGR
jgi:hypothetical protein